MRGRLRGHLKGSRRWAPVALLAGIVLAALYAYGFEGGPLHDRLLRHIVATVLQIFAPLVAGLACLAAARAYAPGDREGTVWTIGAAAALAWTTGRVIFAAYQWWGGTALPYPSLADGFFVAFYLLIGAALLLEIRLVLPLVERSGRVILLAVGIIGWLASFLLILGPIMAGPAEPIEKLLAAFYPTAAVLLVPAGLVPALGFRGGRSAYSWLAVAAAAVCLAAASLGYASLIWYNLYSDVHGVNALWIAAFVLLAAGGLWQRSVQEEV